MRINCIHAPRNVYSLYCERKQEKNAHASTYASVQNMCTIGTLHCCLLQSITLADVFDFV